MTFAYFDTSALVKRYVRERGSAQVVSLLRRHDLLSSAITPVEVLAGLWRRKRNGDLADEDSYETVRRIRGDRTRWELIEVGGTILSRAEEIVQATLPVRALDAIHVASLMAFHAASSIQIPFVTADARQNNAATHLGLDVVWVG